MHQFSSPLITLFDAWKALNPGLQALNAEKTHWNRHETMFDLYDKPYNKGIRGDKAYKRRILNAKHKTNACFALIRCRTAQRMRMILSS